MQNVFIDKLFDRAEAERVAEGAYHAFLRGVLPTPRESVAEGDDEEQTAWEAEATLQLRRASQAGGGGGGGGGGGRRASMYASLKAAVRKSRDVRRSLRLSRRSGGGEGTETSRLDPGSQTVRRRRCCPPCP